MIPGSETRARLRRSLSGDDPFDVSASCNPVSDMAAVSCAIMATMPKGPVRDASLEFERVGGRLGGPGEKSAERLAGSRIWLASLVIGRFISLQTPETLRLRIRRDASRGTPCSDRSGDLSRSLRDDVVRHPRDHHTY